MWFLSTPGRPTAELIGRFAAFDPEQRSELALGSRAGVHLYDHLR